MGMKQNLQSLCSKIGINGDCVLTLLELAERISGIKQDTLEAITNLMDKNYLDKKLNPIKEFGEIINFLTGKNLTHKIQSRISEKNKSSYIIEVWGLDEAHKYFRLHNWDAMIRCKWLKDGNLLYYHIFGENK
jgi:hypothetical protein